MGHVAFLARDLHLRLARLGQHADDRIEHEARASDERFVEIDRVVEDHRDRQRVVVPDVGLGHRGLVARLHAVAPDHVVGHVRGVGHEHVPLPLAGGEPAGRVGRVLRRVQPAVHPDRVGRTVDRAAESPRDDPAGNRIEVGDDPQVLRSHHHVLRGVQDALPLGHRLQRHLVGVGAGAAFVVQRDAGVIADVGSGRALDPVFVDPVGPRAREIDLRERRRRAQAEHDRRRGGRQPLFRHVRHHHQRVEQGVGSHFAPFASLLKLRLVIHRVCRYVGSSTKVVMTSHSVPARSFTMSQYSVSVVLSL